MPMVINALWGGHTDRHTDTDTDPHTYRCADKNDFKKPDMHSQKYTLATSQYADII